MPRGDAAPATQKIRLAGVGKRFVTRDREVQALQPIDLAVRPHEFVALVGPSGCGKSTILNLVAGLLPPSEGQVWYDGAPVNGLNRSVGYMTQKDTLLPWRSAADNVRIALELKCRAVPRDEANARVAQIIDLVGLTGFERHYPAELSGGMRKRVASGADADLRARDAADGRAVRRAGCAVEAADAEPVAGPDAAAAHDRGVRHARPGRGDHAGGSRRGVQRAARAHPHRSATSTCRGRATCSASASPKPSPICTRNCGMS